MNELMSTALGIAAVVSPIAVALVIHRQSAARNIRRVWEKHCRHVNVAARSRVYGVQNAIVQMMAYHRHIAVPVRQGSANHLYPLRECSKPFWPKGVGITSYEFESQWESALKAGYIEADTRFLYDDGNVPRPWDRVVIYRATPALLRRARLCPTPPTLYQASPSETRRAAFQTYYDLMRGLWQLKVDHTTKADFGLRTGLCGMPERQAEERDRIMAGAA